MRTNILKIGLSCITSLTLINADTNSTMVECVTTQEQLSQSIGDDLGNQVMITKKVYQHCTETYERQGPCISWENQSFNSPIPTVYGVGIENYEDTGNIADALGTVAAINQTTAIFNGVKGYCEEGMTEDLSWLEDPMFWASIAMSVISAMGEPTQAMSDAAENAQSAADELSSMSNTLDQAQDAYDALPVDATAEQISAAESALDAASTNYDAAFDASQSAAAEQATELSKMTDIQKLANVVNNGYSGCAVSASINMLDAALDYVDEDEDCDPIDEFCSADDEASINMSDPTMIRTLTLSEYNQLLTDNPDIINQVEVIDDGADSGFVTVRILSMGELVDYDSIENEQEMEDAKQAAKDAQFALKSTFAAASMASCMGGVLIDGDANQLGPETGGAIPAGSSDMLLSSAINMLPFPYNTIGSVVLKLAETWQPVDTCRDEDDANAAGGRHEKAFRGIKYNTCHPISNPRVIATWPTGDTRLTGYDFCCFDSPISKILMVQLKSSIGKGWTHCTDITLNELSHASFRACTADEKNPATNGGFLDGATFRGVEGVDYDMKDSYQYQFQCMNLSELEEYIESQVPIDFSQTHVSEILNDLASENDNF